MLLSADVYAVALRQVASPYYVACLRCLALLKPQNVKCVMQNALSAEVKRRRVKVGLSLRAACIGFGRVERCFGLFYEVKASNFAIGNI